MRGSSAMLGPSPDGGFGDHRACARSGGRLVQRASSLTASASRWRLSSSASTAAHGRVADGLGLGDGLGHLPDPLFPAPDIVPLLGLVDDDLRVTPLTLLDEQGGQEPALGVGLEIGHQCLRWRQRRAPQAVRSRRRPGCATSSSSRTGRSSARASSKCKQEGQQVALREAGRGQAAAGGVAALGPARGRLGGHAPGRPEAAGPRSRAGSRRRPGAGRPRARAWSLPRHWTPSTAGARRGRVRWRGRAACRGPLRRAPGRGRRTAAGARRRAARERLGAFGAQEAVRIVAGREHGDPDGEHAGLARSRRSATPTSPGPGCPGRRSSSPRSGSRLSGRRHRRRRAR